MTDKKLIRIDKKELPEGWEVAKIEDISTVILGQSPASSSYNTDGEGLPFFQGKAEFGPSYPQAVKWCTEPKKTALKNDVLISVRAPVGPTNLSPAECCIGRGLAAIRPNDGISYKYLLYYIRSIESKIESLGTGTTFKAITGKILKNLPVSLAPENEQVRIVAEIEKQFSRLDEAVENLKRVKANLKRYKASVLKAAVEGKLTEEWRAKNEDVEPANKLLERILAERRKKWEEAELACLRERATRRQAGKVPKDDKWKKKYKEPSQADISTLDELPKGWFWLTSDQLFWFVTSGSRGWAKYYSDSGAVFLRIGNLDHHSVSLDLKKVQFVKPPRGAEGIRTRVEENDILISITADVGMIGVIPRGFDEAYINQHISLARPVSSVNSLYIAWYLTSRLGQNQFSVLQRGATKAGLGLDDIRSVNIPMPSFEEQAEVISQIEKRLSVVDEIEIEVDKNQKRADRLRQSILRKAFSGELHHTINQKVA